MHRPQLVLLTKRFERRTVRLHTKALRCIAEFGHTAFNRREPLRQECLVAVLHERGTELLPADLGGMIEHVLNRTVRKQQLRRGLGAYAGHARNIVRAVPHQPLHVDEADRREAVLLLECRRIVGTRVADALFRQDDGETVTDQLQRVTVARHDDGLRTALCGLRCERADDVIRLVVVQFEKGDAEALRELLQEGDLRDQLLGGLVTRPLVVGIECRAERRAALVKRNDNLRRCEFFEQLYEHHRKAVHRVRVDAACIRRELQRVERAKEKAAPIENGKSLPAHRVGLSSSSRRMRTKQ